jgi:phospholipid-binding lipoprotein MlaA
MTLTIRRAYPVLIILYLALTLAGCATTTANLPPEVPAMHTVSEIGDDFVMLNTAKGPVKLEDPWVGYNRSIYKFNYNFDKYIFLPIVNTYEYIAPTVVQTGVSNFFNNIAEIRTLYNSLLQGKGQKSLTTLERFATNTTIGILGFFDPATGFGMKRQNEDFGQTLGYYDVGTGPYFVLPILGPGTVRSTGGFVVDTAIHAGVKSGLDVPSWDIWGNENTGNTVVTVASVFKAIDNRHQEPFRYHDSGYPFEYELVKFLYAQSRELQVMK